jgi:dTDP-4-dehydrorhamnose reductase
MILITGASGKLGRELKKVYPNAMTPSHKELDITNAKAVRNYLSIHKPDIVIHTAALTGIRDCEQNRELAWKTNVLAARDLVTTCFTLNSDCYFIYISTACVFYGDRGNYTEDDIP